MKEKKMKETVLEICNMKDPLCAAGIEKQIASLLGVHLVSSNPINGTTMVKHDETIITINELKKEVDRMGLYCHCESLPHHHGRMAIEQTVKEDPTIKTDLAHDHDQTLMEKEPDTQRMHEEMDHTEMVEHGEMDHTVRADYTGMDMGDHAEHEEMDHEDHEVMDHAAEDHSAHGGHAWMTMADMAIDMRNRFILALALTIPIFTIGERNIPVGSTSSLWIRCEDMEFLADDTSSCLWWYPILPRCTPRFQVQGTQHERIGNNQCLSRVRFQCGGDFSVRGRCFL
ncbi:MAG: heavy-metal-associated domain-containing protein [Candidatus Thorarchaeota archaeon]